VDGCRKRAEFFRRHRLRLKRAIGLDTLIKDENGKRRILAFRELYIRLIWSKLSDIARAFGQV